MRSGSALCRVYLSAGVTAAVGLWEGAGVVVFGSGAAGCHHPLPITLRGNTCTTTHTTHPVKHWTLRAAVHDILYLAQPSAGQQARAGAERPLVSTAKSGFFTNDVFSGPLRIRLGGAASG